jgi:hypothetical protein
MILAVKQINETTNPQSTVGSRANRGLSIAGPRITLDQIVDHTKAAYLSKYIRDLYDLTELPLVEIE